MKVEMLQKKNLSDQVYDHIKRMILSGELKGGERIPEEQLSKLFGVSRTPLRDALRKLEDYGLVFVKPRSYSEVAIIGLEEAKQIAQVRLDLEILAANLFSQNASSKNFQELESLLEKCREGLNKKEKALVFELDSEIHLYISKFSGNKILYEIFEKLDARVQLLRLNQQLPLDDLKNYIQQHSILYNAMKNKESKLIESILSSHILHDFNKITPEND